MSLKKTKGWAQILELMFQKYKDIPNDKRGIPVVGVFVQHQTKNVISEMFVTDRQNIGGTHVEIHMINSLPKKGSFDLILTLSPCRKCYIALNEIMNKNQRFKRCLFLLENKWSEVNEFKIFNKNSNFLSLFKVNNTNAQQTKAISFYEDLHKFSIEIIKHQNKWMKKRAIKKEENKFKHINYIKEELTTEWKYKSLRDK